MAAYRSHSRQTAHCRAAALPDNRVIVASALLSLTVLLLMLCAGMAGA